jgi:hypothetical protein
MKFSSLSAAVIAAGVLACAPAFAQTTPTAEKQKTQSLSHSDPGMADSVTKQKTQSFSHSDSGIAYGVTKQKTQSLSHSDSGLADGVSKQK